MNNPACANCRYFSNPGGYMGLCQRHAPVYVPVDFQRPQPYANRDWPGVKAVDWCGDHEYSPAAAYESTNGNFI